MKNLLQTIIFIALCLISIVLFLVIGKSLLLLYNKIDEIDPNIIVAIIGGTVTVLGYFITRYLEKKKEIEQQIREQKLPAYEEFVDFIFTIFKAEKTTKNKSHDTKKIADFFWSMNKKSILWLSDKTLKSYITWKRLTSEFSEIEKPTNKDNLLILASLEELLKDYRVDIGHKNEGLETGDILSLFITDWNEISKKEG